MLTWDLVMYCVQNADSKYTRLDHIEREWCFIAHAANSFCAHCLSARRDWLVACSGDAAYTTAFCSMTY